MSETKKKTLKQIILKEAKIHEDLYRSYREEFGEDSCLANYEFLKFTVLKNILDEAGISRKRKRDETENSEMKDINSDLYSHDRQAYVDFIQAHPCARGNLALLRRKKGFTAEAAASVLGISKRTYLRLEAGDTNGQPEYWIKLADVFGVTPEELFEPKEGIVYASEKKDSGRNCKRQIFRGR